MTEENDKMNSYDAPRHRLADLREWLMDRIDGSEETRGEDGLISGFIRQIDALEAQIVSLTQPKTIAEWQAAKSSEIAEPRGCPTPGACSAVAEQTRLRQMAEHERDALLEQLIAARSATAALPVEDGTIPDEVRKFLLGVGPLEGVHFGGDHPTEKGKFWWRKYLLSEGLRSLYERGEAMSCPHGNHVDACDLCDEVDAAWDRGYNAAIEKAAKVCAEDESGRDSGGYFAEEIRALKRPEPQGERNGQ